MSILKRTTTAEPDVVLIGAGIMSATLGMLLKELEPGLSIQIFERLDVAAAESSDAWNNAGTGHSAFCELNYTPEKKDGTVDTSKAVNIAESFEISREFWSYLVENNIVKPPASFIRRIPHISFVWGEKNVSFLHNRYDALQDCHLFKEMQFTTEKEKIASWIPLVMEDRDPEIPVAATKMDIGTDVNFGALTRCMFNCLKERKNVNLYFNHEVRDIDKNEDGTWTLKLKDESTGKKIKVKTRFIFIGAGGGSLPLLLKSGIPEGNGYGGFPVSGQWLRCTNRDIIERHNAKVYGTAAVGSPPMSVPHLDTRWIKGKKELLFGPYAGFTTKFLKHGSIMDLPRSIRMGNIKPMLAAGLQNLPLTKYLIEQVRLTPEGRLEALKEYFPAAKMEDWELEIAGQRVQVIKKDEEEGGILEFGTEVVSAADGSIAALLGASPGASTAVSIMITILKRCFADRMSSESWQNKLKKMIPSYGESLGSDARLCAETRSWTSRVLRLESSETKKEAALVENNYETNPVTL
jgi:malate dehydrogenase (quinone)